MSISKTAALDECAFVLGDGCRCKSAIYISIGSIMQSETGAFELSTVHLNFSRTVHPNPILRLVGGKHPEAERKGGHRTIRS